MLFCPKRRSVRGVGNLNLRNNTFPTPRKTKMEAHFGCSSKDLHATAAMRLAFLAKSWAGPALKK